jgi:hypothetical protein
MIRKIITASAAVLLGLALLAPAAARAQEQPASGTTARFADGGTSSDVKDAKADDEGPKEGDFGQVVPVPGWSIKPEVQALGNSMKQFNTLIGSLNRANKDLSDEFQKYLKDPKNEVVASSLERKMAVYAAQVQGEFSTVISEQDSLSSNFRMLRRKLQQLSGHLGTKAGDFGEKLKTFQVEAKKQEKDLIDLAIKIKENPPEDPDELKRLKHDFLLKTRRYNLKNRYVHGYGARLANYQQLRKNLEKLSDLFVSLHEKFGDLMDNLQNEKQYLKDSIELQADTLRIKQIIRDGIFGGENAIKNVSEKLADLYVKVDAFTQVHDRINADLNKFVESQTELLNVSEKLDKIGAIDFGANAQQDIDKTIDDFYKKKDAPPSDDDLMLKGATEGGK